MIKAKDIMTKNVVTVGPDAALTETTEILVRNEISGLPVIDGGGNMIGIITEKDILNSAFRGNLYDKKVKDVMSQNVISFSPEVGIEKIALSFGNKPFRRVPIIENNRVVGIISRRDIIRVVLQLNNKILA